MTITLDKIANGLPSNNIDITKASQTSKGNGNWHSLWMAAGYPAAGAKPPAFTAGSGYTPGLATVGGFNNANAAGGNQRCLASMQMNSTVAGTIIAYDRLWACSGMVANVTTAQTVTTPGNLPTGRDPTSGADVEPWFECYAPTGATGTGVYTLTGVDSTGTAGRTWTYTRGSAITEITGQMMPFIPATAVGGCRQVTSVTLSVSTATAGEFGVTLMRRASQQGVIAANVAAPSMDVLDTGAPRIYDDSAMALMVQCSTTTTGLWLGQIGISEYTP